MIINKKQMKRTFSSGADQIFNAGFLIILFLIVLADNPVFAGQPVPSPKEHFGFNIGDDYCLATYAQTEEYFMKLAASDRARLVDIGLTEEGRHQYMLIISSPSNIKDLEVYKNISVRLGRAAGLDDNMAKELSDKGKAVVWIDGGLHATEVVGTHQLIETAWQLISRNDKETTEILDNVIVLLAHANPDGQELVSSWYMRHEDPEKRSMNIPRLYQKYAGHDNNRDFYMLSLKETRNMSKQLYIEWLPQILYNHHQRGPAGTVLAGPPYRDPFNYVIDPLVMTSIDAVGAAMVSRLIAEGKPGYTMRTGASFSTWYNGGLRTTSYFHNIIGLLTEIIGHPTPEEVPFVAERLLPDGANPFPATPQKWHFRQSIDYSLSLNYAVLEYASRNRADLLYNFYLMGRNSIEKGRRDNVTFTPGIIEGMKSAYEKARKQENQPSTGEKDYGSSGLPVKYFHEILNDPLRKDPRAYVIPSNQNDFPTAIKFINALIGSGISIHKALTDFSIIGKSYPAGSFVVMADQAFRPYIIDLFEPQDHPDDLQYPGGPPVPPYDAAGWTLAFQMGIEFDRIFINPEGPFESIPYGELQPLPEMKFPSVTEAGFILDPRVNNSFIAVNDLLALGITVSRLTERDKETPGAGPGTFYIPSSKGARKALEQAAGKYGLQVRTIKHKPSSLLRISQSRIGIWNRYGGSIPSGWTGLILEQFNFPYRFIYPQEIDSGDLRKKFDVIIFPGGAIPSYNPNPAGEVSKQGTTGSDEDIPEKYRGWTGNITPEKSIPQIRKFIEEGGTVIAIGSSTNLAYHLGLPVKNALLKKDKDGRETGLSRTEYFIPGSLLTAETDTLAPANWGMPFKSYVVFDRSPVFRVEPDASSKGVKALAWFGSDKPLASGWALGQGYLKDGVAAFEAQVGKGKLYAYGPEITFRSQPHGTYKMLINQLYTTSIAR